LVAFGGDSASAAKTVSAIGPVADERATAIPSVIHLAPRTVSFGNRTTVLESSNLARRFSRSIELQNGAKIRKIEFVVE
jgi:hypothetical protein